VQNRDQVTHLLGRWASGDRQALDSLTEAIYAELHKIADAYIKRERSGHTLQPTALVNEAWVRLAGYDPSGFANRKQFLALAAQLMRRILVDHARSLSAEKRGGGGRKTTLVDATNLNSQHAEEFLILNDALTRLSDWSPRKAQIIEMRYFGGLNVQEVSDLLGVSIATISREQKMAEAWLEQTMASPEAGEMQ
jgi:RNA polymerase sigma-70 factor (ECF subfamily)